MTIQQISQPTKKNKGSRKSKSNKKYVTIKNGEGLDFRKISKIMTKNGYPLNHASIRNIFISSLEELIFITANTLKTNIKKSNVKKMITSQNIHDNLSEVIHAAYQELILEQENNKL